MADQDFVLAPQTVTVGFALEPVLNTLNTLMIISDLDHLSGFSDWIEQTGAQLTVEQRRTNMLIIHGLFDALLTNANQASFPAYIDYLAARDPDELRDAAMNWMCEEEKLAYVDMQPLRQEALLENLQVYLQFHRRLREKKQAAYGDKYFDDFDEGFYTALHGLFNDPPTMQSLLISHLRMMWLKVLERDWNQNFPVLQECIEAFKQQHYSGLTPMEAIRAVTGRDLSGAWDETLGGAKHIIFVPSVHIGPYVRQFEGKDAVHIFFGARLPEGVRSASPELSRSELLVRFNALADDTRLQILVLLTRHDELCAQDIMTMLNLSQSSTSRHLRQLTATGYVTERRREVAKCYSLNPARVDDTLAAFRTFLKI